MGNPSFVLYLYNNKISPFVNGEIGEIGEFAE
jgi:hypothetical protein